MADEADMAQQTESLYLDAALRRRPGPELPAIGICHYCGEAVHSSAKFCDNECADEWDREQSLRRKNGDAG